MSKSKQKPYEDRFKAKVEEFEAKNSAYKKRHPSAEKKASSIKKRSKSKRIAEIKPSNAKKGLSGY